MTGPSLIEATVLIIFCNILVSGKDILEVYRPNPSLPQELNEWLTKVQEHKSDFRLIRDSVGEEPKSLFHLNEDYEQPNEEDTNNLSVNEDKKDKNIGSTDKQPQNDIYPYMFQGLNNNIPSFEETSLKKKRLSSKYLKSPIRLRRSSNDIPFFERKNPVNIEFAGKIGELKRSDEKYPDSYAKNKDSILKNIAGNSKIIEETDNSKLNSVKKREIQIDIKNDGKLVKEIHEDSKSPKSIVLNIQSPELSKEPLVNPKIFEPKVGNFENIYKNFRVNPQDLTAKINTAPELNLRSESNQVKNKEVLTNFNTLFNANEHLNTDNSLAHESSTSNQLIHHFGMPDVNTYLNNPSNIINKYNPNNKQTWRQNNFNNNNMKDMSSFWTNLEKNQMQKGLDRARFNKNFLAQNVRSFSKNNKEGNNIKDKDIASGFEPAQRIELDSDINDKKDVNNINEKNEIISSMNYKDPCANCFNGGNNINNPNCAACMSNMNPINYNMNNNNNINDVSNIKLMNTLNGTNGVIGVNGMTNTNNLNSLNYELSLNQQEGNRAVGNNDNSFKDPYKIENKRQLQFLESNTHLINSDILQTDMTDIASISNNNLDSINSNFITQAKRADEGYTGDLFERVYPLENDATAGIKDEILEHPIIQTNNEAVNLEELPKPIEENVDSSLSNEEELPNLESNDNVNDNANNEDMPILKSDDNLSQIETQVENQDPGVIVNSNIGNNEVPSPNENNEPIGSVGDTFVNQPIEKTYQSYEEPPSFNHNNKLPGHHKHVKTIIRKLNKNLKNDNRVTEIETITEIDYNASEANTDAEEKMMEMETETTTECITKEPDVEEETLKENEPDFCIEPQGEQGEIHHPQETIPSMEGKQIENEEGIGGEPIKNEEEVHHHEDTENNEISGHPEKEHENEHDNEAPIEESHKIDEEIHHHHHHHHHENCLHGEVHGHHETHPDVCHHREQEEHVHENHHSKSMNEHCIMETEPEKEKESQEAQGEPENNQKEENNKETIIEIEHQESPENVEETHHKPEGHHNSELSEEQVEGEIPHKENLINIIAYEQHLQDRRKAHQQFPKKIVFIKNGPQKKRKHFDNKKLGFNYNLNKNEQLFPAELMILKKRRSSVRNHPKKKYKKKKYRKHKTRSLMDNISPQDYDQILNDGRQDPIVSDSSSLNNLIPAFIGRQLKAVDYEYDAYLHKPGENFDKEFLTSEPEITHKTNNQNRISTLSQNKKSYRLGLLHKNSAEGDYNEEEESATKTQTKKENNIIKKSDNEFANPRTTTEAEDYEDYDDCNNVANIIGEKSKLKQTSRRKKKKGRKKTSIEKTDLQPTLKSHDEKRSAHRKHKRKHHKKKKKKPRSIVDIKQDSGIPGSGPQLSFHNTNENELSGHLYIDSKSDFQHWPSFVINDNDNEEKLRKRSLELKKKYPRAFNFPLASNDFFVKQKRTVSPAIKRDKIYLLDEGNANNEMKLPQPPEDDIQKVLDTSMKHTTTLPITANEETETETCKDQGVNNALTDACEDQENFNKTSTQVTAILALAPEFSSESQEHCETNNDTDSYGNNTYATHEKLDDILNGKLPLQLVSTIMDSVSQNMKLKSRFHKGLKQVGADKSFLKILNETNLETQKIVQSMTNIMNKLQYTATCQALPRDLKRYVKSITKHGKLDALAKTKEMEGVEFDENQNQDNFIFESSEQGDNLEGKVKILQDLLKRFNKLPEKCKSRAIPVKEYIENHLGMLKNMLGTMNKGTQKNNKPKKSIESNQIPSDTFKSEEELIQEQLESVGLGKKHKFTPKFDLDQIVENNKLRKFSTNIQNRPTERSHNVNVIKRDLHTVSSSKQYNKLVDAVRRLRLRREGQKRLAEMYGKFRESGDYDGPEIKNADGEDISKANFESPLVYSL